MNNSLSHAHPSHLVVKGAFAASGTLRTDPGEHFRQLLGFGQGPVHLGIATCSLQDGSETQPCMHAYEKGIFVLEGSLELSFAGVSGIMPPGGYALVPTATPYKIVNRFAGTSRWIEGLAPQPRLRSEWRDTVAFPNFTGDGAAFAIGHPLLRHMGVFSGTMPPAFFHHPDLRRGSQKMLIDKENGAVHFNMFIVEFENEGLCNHHDHPFEEAYLLLEGRVRAVFENRSYVLEAGDLAWCGVGTRHAFFAEQCPKVRWLEFQSPQPPSREGMRWHAPWEKLLPSV